MKFQVADPIPFSLDEGFLLIRDEMPSLVPYMKDTESIDVLERREEGETVHLVNQWRASNASVPKALRGIMKPELLGWTDYATWTTDTRSAAWRLEALGSGKLFTCKGTTSVQEIDGEVKLCVDVDFSLHPENIPGIPKLLARTLTKQIEKFLVDLLKENMRQLAISMQKYAAERA